MAATKNHNKTIGFLLLGLLAACWVSYGLLNKLFWEVELISWDVRQQLIADSKRADQNIKIIMIDQNTLEYYQKHEDIQWPFPRALYSTVIQLLNKAGARGVAFDILYTETSVYGEGDDKEFGDLTGSMSIPVIHAASLVNAAKDEESKDLTALIEKTRHDIPEGLPARLFGGAVLSSAVFPVPPILKTSTSVGIVNAEPDQDSIIRHVRAGRRLGKEKILSLPFSLYLNAGGDPAKVVDAVRFADSGGEFTLRYHGPHGTYPTYNLVNVVSSWVALEQGEEPPIDISEFKDAWVFVGVWAPGLHDIRPVPLDVLYRGVEIHATTLDNLLTADFIKQASTLQSILFGLLGVILALVSVFLSPRFLTQLLGQTLVVALMLLTCTLAAFSNVWIPLVVPISGTVGLILLGFAYQYHIEGRQNRFIKGAFGHYVSPAIIDRILRDPSALSLGGERKNISIFFSDLAGFTTISEGMEPQELARLLNIYLSAMTDIILDSGGTLDKYEGDAIIAFWNAPLDIENHQLAAINAALECQRKLAEMNRDLKQEFDIELKMRIGVHCGEVSVGNFGSHSRFDYTMIGDATNLAARLEGVNKVFGTETLISEDLLRAAGEGLVARRVGAVRVVGRAEPITIYEPLPASISEETARNLKEFRRALDSFDRGQISEALSIFRKLKEDPVAQAYLLRVEQSGQIEEAVWNLTEK